MSLDFPFHIDARGRAAEVSGDDHIRDMIEQVLFTHPGERVNRPDFGCGLLQLVFAPNSDALTAAVHATVQGSLQQWLGDLVSVDSVDVHNDDAELHVSVRYRVRHEQDQQLAVFSRSVT